MKKLLTSIFVMLLSCVYCAAEDGETLLYSTSFTEWSSQTYTGQQMMSYSGIDFTLSYVKIVPNSKPTSVSSYEGTGYLQPSNGSNLSSCYFQTSKLSYVSRVSYTQAAGTIGCGWRLESSNDGVYFYPFNENETGCTSKNTPETKEVAVYMSDVWLRWTPITTGSTTTSIYLMDINIYGVNGEGGIGGTDPITDPIHDETCDFESLEYLPSGDEQYTNRFKVCSGSDVSAVNIQQPGFANEVGIYLIAPMAIVSCSLSEDKYVIQGAGIVLYCSAFANEITTVNISTPDEEYTVQVYQRKEEPTPTMQPVVALAGDFNEWDTSANVLVPDADNLTASVTVHLSVSNYLFKIVVDGTWLSLNGDGDGMYRFHRDWTSVSHVNMENGTNFNLNTDVEGDYTFTWTYADSTITITFPEYTPVVGDNAYYLIGNTEQLGAWNPNSALLMENNTITVNLPAGSYSIKVLTEEKTWETELDCNSLLQSCSSTGLSSDADYNIRFTLEEASDVTVTVDYGKLCVTGAFKPYEQGKFSNYAVLINQERLVPCTFAGLSSTGVQQYVAHVQLGAGELLQVINRADKNSVANPTLEEAGEYSKFTYDSNNQGYICSTAGCYDIYFKPSANTNYRGTFYVGAGSEDCSTGDAFDGIILPTRYVYVATRSNTANSVGSVTIDGYATSSTYAYGNYIVGSTITLQAYPVDDYQFLQWSDGDLHNPRQLIVTQDTTLYPDLGDLAYYPTGILLNHNRFIRSTYTDGTQLIVRANIQQGDKVELYYINDNIYWMAEVEPYGLYENFTGGAEQGYLTCNVSGCYDIYLKMEEGITKSIYIGEGTVCYDGVPWTDPNISYVFSLVGTENLFGVAWNTEDTTTNMNPVGDGRFEYTLDSVTLIPGGDYQYKVIANHAWNVEEYPSVQEDDNYTITVETPGVYSVLFSLIPGEGCTATTNLLHATGGNESTGRVWNISPSSPNEYDNLRLVLFEAEDGDTIVMTEGTYVESNNNYISFTGKHVIVKAEEGADVIIQPQTPIIIKEGGCAHFENVKFDVSRLTELGIYDHLMYPNDDNEVNSIILDGCEFYDFTLNSSLLYCATTRRLASISISNCYFHDIKKSCLYIENTAETNVSITNSTFANITTDASGYYAGVIDTRATTGTFTIDHCTFYNVQPMNTDYAAIGKVSTSDAMVSNSIFAMPESTDGIRAIRDVAEANSCLIYNYIKDSNWGIHSNVVKNNCINNQDPKFRDAANGDFTLSEGSPAIGAANDGSNLGDPRWGIDEQIPSTDFSVPYMFVGETATLSGNIQLNESHHIAWPGKSENGVAVWKINVTRACAVKASIQVETGVTSGHQFSVTVLDANQEAIAELTQPSASYDDTWIGLKDSIHFSTPGNYTIVLSNLTAWSEAAVDGVIFTLSIIDDGGNTGEDVLYSTTFSDWEQQTISEGQTMMYGNITFMANNIKVVPGQKPSSVSDASIGYIQPTKTSSVYLQTGMLPFVSRVTYVQAAGTAGRGWILESSGDGENWYAFNENDPGCDAANIAETKEMYVYMENVWLRWVPTSANPGTNIYLNEITIYGTSGSTPSSDPQIVASGYCSADGSPSVTWLLTSDSILTIGGYGAMADYDAETNMAPWYEYKDAYNSAYIASGVTYVGNYAFRQCTNLRYVDMESSVTSLGSYCFDDCWYIESITCRAMTPPETAYSSFAGVNYMIPIYVPEASLELYPAADGWNGFTDYRAIDGGSQSCVIASGSCGADGENLTWMLDCDSVLTISGEGAMPSSYASNATPWYEYGQWIKHINIEEGVTKLAMNSFYNSGASANYPNVRTLSIPSTLGAPIETSFFYGCPLKTVTILSDSIVGKASYSSNSSLQTKFGAQVEEYIIGGSVRSIANFAFYNQSPDSLCSIYLPEGLEAIGNWAFGYIDHLTSVTVPSTVQTIGTDAFAGCSNLRSVELGEGLMTVNGQAFWMCDNLTQVSCYAMNPPTLNSTSFDHYDTLIVRCEAKSLYQEAEYWKKFTLIMCPDDTTGGYVEPDAPEQITFALDSSWKFIMLPTVFGMIQDDIIVDGGEIEWGIYNSEQRATGMSGWQGFVPSSGFSASRSYIIRARNGSATLTINVPEQAREKAGAAIPFAYYESAHQQNANWNFLGNPYPFSYDIMAALLAQGITSPIAVWNGIGYITYTPGIDVKILDPFEAFFIQMPQNGVQAIQYTPEYIVADNGSMNTGDNSVADEHGALPGYFTINSSKEKVHFSRGNLQYNAAKDMWQFAENQYEIIGEGNANISSAYDGWIDLFGWGTGNNPTKTSTSNCDYSSFVDWGTNAISNGGNTADMWRTLSANEWTYITGQRTNCDSLCGRATVNGIQGFILLPDDWVSPGIPFQGSQNQGYELNQYSLEDWQKMEAAGAVFLPACGGRSGTEYSGGGLQYWSTNDGTSCYAYDIITAGASDYKLKTNQIGRQGGYGVRLVK